MTALPDLFAPAPPPHSPISRRAPSRILSEAEPLPARSGDDVRWVRALLEEWGCARDSRRRAKTYSLKPTTSAPERGHQTELYQKHMVREERVVIAFVEAIRSR